MPQDSFDLPLTAEQFAAARATLASNPQVVTHRETSPFDGTFTSHDIDFGYAYDAGAQKVTVTVLKRHGSVFTNHAPLSVVQEHFESLLG